MSPTGKSQWKAVVLNLKYEKSGARTASSLVLHAGKAALVCYGMVFTGSQSAAADWPELPVPDDAKVVVVGEDMNINGLPTRISELSSSRSPEEILSYYRQEWQAPAVSDGPGYIEKEAGGWQILSRYEEPYFYTVQVSESAMGSSFGFLAVSMPMELVNYEPEELAMPAGSEILSDVVSDDAGKRGRVVHFKNSQSIEANYNFYVKRYLADGWAELSHLPADRNKALLLMNKGSGEVSIVFNRLDNESYGVLVESHE